MDRAPEKTLKGRRRAILPLGASVQKLLVSLAASACLVGLLSVAPARAALITFVSGGGLDTNDCLSPQTACRQISFALTQTDPTGTVHVLHGEYDAFVVDKSVDIIAELGTASIADHTAVAVPGGGVASILVQGEVIVRIRGFHIYNPAGGIVSIDAEVLHIEDCVITPGASAFGIDFRNTSTETRELYVLDTVVTGDASSGGGGVVILPTGAAGAKVVLDRVRIEDNHVGILVNGGGTTGSIAMNVRDSVISGGATLGLGVFEATSGGPSTVVLTRTTIASNGGQGIVASRALASVRVRQSEITGNAVGVQSLNGGQIISHGDNVLAGNTSNGAFTSTVAPQ